jgi:hypothetical protein
VEPYLHSRADHDWRSFEQQLGSFLRRARTSKMVTCDSTSTLTGEGSSPSSSRTA